MATYTVTDNDLFMTVARNGLAIETIPKSLCSIRVNHYASPMGGVAVDSILVSHNGELAVELSYTDTLVSGVAPSSISDLHSKLLTVLNNVPAPLGGSSAYAPITMAEAAANQAGNAWVDGTWYRITDTVANSFCHNLLYYRAQAYPDPVSGHVRLSTTGYGKITNDNGVSREGYVGFDFTNGDGYISFYDPINNNRIWDKIGVSNGFAIYKESLMSGMVWNFGNCNTTNIPLGQLSVRNSTVGSDGITGTVVSIDALIPYTNISIVNCSIGGGTGVTFTQNGQSFANSTIGTGNTIYLPSGAGGEVPTGWKVGNNNTIGYSDHKFMVLDNLTCGNGNTIIADTDAAYDASGSTFGNDQTYTFTYTLRNCNFAKGYLEYKALLTQSGTSAPTATVIVDEVGGVTYGYNDVGNYSYSTGIAGNKIPYICGAETADQFPYTAQCNTFNIWVYDSSSGVSYSNDELSSTPFTIQIPLP